MDPQFRETAAALTRIFYARLKAGHVGNRLYYSNGFHVVLTAAPSNAPFGNVYEEIKRVDGCEWDSGSWATLFNDITYALQDFHTKRAGNALANLKNVA